MAPAVEARASDPRHACAQGHTHPACTFSRCRRGVLRGGDRTGPEEAGAPPRGSTSRFGTRRETTAPTAYTEATLGRTGTPCPPTELAVLAKKRRPADENPQLLCHNARFLRRGGSTAEKNRKAARNHGHNRRKDENINFSSPNHQQKHVFTPCTSGEMQAEIRTFRRFRGKQGAEYSFYFKASRTKNKKESTTHRRLRRKLCIFTLRPTHFVHSSNDCPRQRSKSTLCPFASWGTMGKGRPLRVRNFPFFVQV